MSKLSTLTAKLTSRYTSGSPEQREASLRVADAWKDRYLRSAGESCTFHFRNQALRDLWEDALMGQISDGMWENTANTGWLFWASLKESVGGATKIEGGIPSMVRKSFNFLSSDLISIVGDDMLAAVQKSEPNATMGQTIKYVKEIMTAMKGGETLEAPAGEGGGAAPTTMPDAQTQIHEHRRMITTAFDAAKLKYDQGLVHGESFSYASQGSRAGQYHYFIIIGVGWGYSVVSAYGKLGKPPKAVLLGANTTLPDALKLVTAKVKSKLSSGYDISNLNGIIKLLDPISGRVVRQTVTTSATEPESLNKLASEKFAANIRGLLSQLFSSFQPYVRNWGAFLQELVNDLESWETVWGGGFTGTSVISLGETSWSTGKLVGGYGSRNQSQQWDPSEYEGGYVNAPDGGSLLLTSSLDLRTFPKTLLQSLSSNVSDKTGFFNAAKSLVENREARLMLAKLLRASTAHSVKNGDASDFAMDEFGDGAVVATPSGYSMDFAFDALTAGPTTFSIAGTSIEVSTPISIEIESENVAPYGADPYGDEMGHYGDWRAAAAKRLVKSQG